MKKMKGLRYQSGMRFTKQEWMIKDAMRRTEGKQGSGVFHPTNREREGKIAGNGGCKNEEDKQYDNENGGGTAIQGKRPKG